MQNKQAKKIFASVPSFFKFTLDEHIINHRRSNNLPYSATPQAAAFEKLTFSAVIKYEIRKCEIKHENKQVITSKLVCRCCAYNIPPPTFPPLIFLLFASQNVNPSGRALCYLLCLWSTLHAVSATRSKTRTMMMVTVLWKLCCAKPGRGCRGRKQLQQPLAEDRVMERQTVLATEVSPKTASLQLSVTAGEHLAQLGSKQQRKPR